MINFKKLRNIKKIILNSVIIVLILGNIQTVSASFTPDIKIYSEGVYMINLDTDVVVFQKNENQRYYPASTSKIMTTLITLENVQNLDAFVEVPGVVMNEFDPANPNKFGASSADIRAGQKNVTYRDCLYALMLASACEAGNILAYNVAGGDISRFITMMNEKAKELGCVNTNFSNAHGLHEDNNYSSVYDMYVITRYVYENYPEFMEMCSAYEYEMPPNAGNPNGYSVFSTNELVKPTSEYFYEFTKGIKTGSIDLYHDLVTKEVTEGHASFVSTAEKNGYTYMLITMGAPYYDISGSKKRGNYHFKDHVALYKWAFDSFERKTVLTKNDIVATMPVLQGENADTVQLKPLDDYHTLLPKEVDNSAIQRVITSDEETITAPVEKGQILGTIELKLADETLATIKLIAADAVELSSIAHVTEKIKEVLDTPWLKIGLVVLAILIVALAVVIAANKSKKAKDKNRGTNRRIKR